MSNPIGYQPLKRWKGLRAGLYQYWSHPDHPPQLVKVEIEEGITWVTFLKAELEDQGERFDARDLPGHFVRV